jgi:hypothetical protein
MDNLANKFKIFRAERTVCSICYYPAIGSVFGLSVPNGAASWGTTAVDTACGIVGFTSTTIVNGGAFDHIVIPDGQCNSPVANGVPLTNQENDRYCGTSFLCMANLAVPNTIAGAACRSTLLKHLILFNIFFIFPVQTVCSQNRPFKISIHSDGLEYIFPALTGEGLLANNEGFSLGR